MFPKFQPVPISAVICFDVLPVIVVAEALGVAHTISIAAAVLPFISAADATCVTHIVIKAAIAKIAMAVMTERVFFAVDIFSLLSW